MTRSSPIPQEFYKFFFSLDPTSKKDFLEYWENPLTPVDVKDEILKWCVVENKEKILEVILPEVTWIQDKKHLETLRLGYHSKSEKVVNLFKNFVPLSSFSVLDQEEVIFSERHLPPTHLKLLIQSSSIPADKMIFLLINRGLQKSFWRPLENLRIQDEVALKIKEVSLGALLSSAKNVLALAPSVKNEWPEIIWDECCAREKQKEFLEILFLTTLINRPSNKNTKNNQQRNAQRNFVSSFIYNHFDEAEKSLSKSRIKQLVKWNEKKPQYLDIFLRKKMSTELGEMKKERSSSSPKRM